MKSLVLLLALCCCARAAILETSIPPSASAKYKSAQYRLFIPDAKRRVRAIIVKQHGCGRNGLAHANDLQWQAFAEKWNAALLGSWLQPSTSDCADWFVPANGSSAAFKKALEHFAKESLRPELLEVPWLLWGHSGGAHWSLMMAEQYPTNVIAVFAQSGGIARTNSPAARVPILFNRGVNDFPNIINTVNVAMAANRAHGALWALSIAPGTKHECGFSRELAIPWFDLMMQERLPPRARKLRPASVTNQVFGASTSLQYARGNHINDPRLSWLPNENFARLWQEFGKTARVADKTPPPRPKNLKAAIQDKTVVLTWEAAIDIEGGIKHFNIYRNNQLWKSYPEPSPTKGPLAFQQGNYGDEADPPSPAMRFVDDQPDPGKNRYEVTAVNHYGLESVRSPASIAK